MSVHVFIGAPTINRCLSHGMDRSPAGGNTAEWKTCRFFYKEQYRSPQNNSEVQGVRVPIGGAQTWQELFCCAAGYEGRPPVLYDRPVSEAEQKIDTAFPHEDIAELVSGTHQCHISPHAQGRPGVNDCLVICDCLDGLLHQKTQTFHGEHANVNLTPSTEAEFISILISGQVALQGNVGGKFQQSLPLNQSSELLLQDKLECSSALRNAENESAHAAQRGTVDEYSTNSLELFSQTSDGGSPPVLFLEGNEDHQPNGRCPEKSSAICFTMLNHQLKNIGSPSHKRRNTLTASFHPPSKKNEKSKRPKQSRSLLKYVSKGCDSQTPRASCTLLKNCSDKTLEYDILAVVLQPCHIKEIQVKSRLKSDSVFPLATVVVLDQSEICCKILMWGAAAFWSLALCPGDIITVTNMKVCEDKWNGGTLLQSTLKSCLQNLGNCFTMVIDEYSDVVEYFVLMELMSYVSTKHYYLRDLPPRRLQKLDRVQHVRLSHLQPELLVHSVLKVNKISVLKECTYRYNGSLQNKIMLTVEEVKGQSCILILWGTSVSWCTQIRLKRHHIWQFRYLLCKKNLISGDVELHTTPWSSCECLFDDDKKAGNFQKQYFQNASSPKLLSLRTLVEERYSGVVRIKGSISELEFPVSDKQSILMTQQSSTTKILLSLSLVKYSGCEKCKRELKIDNNHVYEQCFVCLPFNHVQTFYRPAIITLVNEEKVIWAHVPSDVLQKIFLNICPKLLNRCVTGSTNITYGSIVADLCRSLLAGTGESYLFTIESHFSLDDNSVPLEQEFHILDFHVDI